MKNAKPCTWIFLFFLIFIFGCEDASPEMKQANPSEPTVTGTPVITPVPEATSEPTVTPTQPGETPAPDITGEPTPVTDEPTPVITEEPEPTPEEILPTPTPIPLLITEIMYNPKSPDSDWEWIEVYNTTAHEIDLSGWVIDDGNKEPHSSANIESGTIPSHGTGILFNCDILMPAEFLTAWGSGINLIPVKDWANMGLNNTGDKIGIWNSFSSYNGDHELFLHALFAIQYSGSSPWPDNNGAGSIYLTDLASDYTDGTQWALSMDGENTPLGTCYQSTEGGTNTGDDIGSPYFH